MQHRKQQIWSATTGFFGSPSLLGAIGCFLIYPFLSYFLALILTLHQPKTLTPISKTELIQVLDSSYQEAFGSKPTKITLATAWAHIAVENGGGKLSYNHNLGCLGADRWQPFYRVAGSRFASFSSHLEGAKTYWKHLKTHCQMALIYLKIGNADNLAHSLANCGYHGTNIEHYAAQIRSLQYIGYRLVEQQSP